VNVAWIFQLPADANPADAFRLLIAAIGRSGPNRTRLREVLAEAGRKTSATVDHP
jgi:hypothetical protein